MGKNMLHWPRVTTYVGVSILVLVALNFYKNRGGLKIQLQAAHGTSDCLAGLLSAALFYFRYFVASPFPIGHGQSWSQFKLAEWAFPFAFSFFLMNLLVLCQARPILLQRMIIGLFLLSLVGVCSYVQIVWHLLHGTM